MNLFENFSPGMNLLLFRVFTVLAIIVSAFLLYRFFCRMFIPADTDRSRAYRLRSLFRFFFGSLGLVGVLALLTTEWTGLLVSVGVLGVAVTFLLQQPLLSFLGWFYITVKKPFEAGDRVRIEDIKGEVLSIDYLVTTMLEVGGDLVSSNQPSGALITIPNSKILESTVQNYTSEKFPWVWSEISLQVSYESDIEFARNLMEQTARDYLGQKMEEMIADYRRFLEDTPLEIEMGDRPSVNIQQKESWVELRLRYLTHPRKGQKTKNELYEKILNEINDHPDRVSFPVSRSR